MLKPPNFLTYSWLPHLSMCKSCQQAPLCLLVTTIAIVYTQNKHVLILQQPIYCSREVLGYIAFVTPPYMWQSMREYKSN